MILVENIDPKQILQTKDKDLLISLIGPELYEMDRDNLIILLKQKMEKDGITDDMLQLKYQTKKPEPITMDLDDQEVKGIFKSALTEQYNFYNELSQQQKIVDKENEKQIAAKARLLLLSLNSNDLDESPEIKILTGLEKVLNGSIANDINESNKQSILEMLGRDLYEMPSKDLIPTIIALSANIFNKKNFNQVIELINAYFQKGEKTEDEKNLLRLLKEFSDDPKMMNLFSLLKLENLEYMPFANLKGFSRLIKTLSNEFDDAFIQLLLQKKKNIR